jgi:Putative Actinobacterial Holin-X, holin superfamily III
MASQDQSILDLLKAAISDAQELIHSELALVKAEVRQELSRIQAGVVAFAGAAIAAIVAVGLLATTIAWALSAGFGWPAWAGFAVVTLLMVVVAAALASVGRRRFAAQPPMPLTVDTLKENAKWIRARTS